MSYLMSCVWCIVLTVWVRAKRKVVQVIVLATVAAASLVRQCGRGDKSRAGAAKSFANEREAFEGVALC